MSKRLNEIIKKEKKQHKKRPETVFFLVRGSVSAEKNSQIRAATAIIYNIFISYIKT
jgi:hypothetical protein